MIKLWQCESENMHGGPEKCKTGIYRILLFRRSICKGKHVQRSHGKKRKSEPKLDHPFTEASVSETGRQDPVGLNTTTNPFVAASVSENGRRDPVDFNQGLDDVLAPWHERKAGFHFLKFIKNSPGHRGNRGVAGEHHLMTQRSLLKFYDVISRKTNDQLRRV